MSKDLAPWQVRGLDPTDPRFYPSLVGHNAVVDYAAASRGVKTTASRIKRATESGELAYSIVSGKRAYAPADVDSFLLGLRKSVSA